MPASAEHGSVVSATRPVGKRAGLFLVFTVLLHDGWKRRVHAESSVLFVRGMPGPFFNRSAGSLRRLAVVLDEVSKRSGLGLRERLDDAQQEARDRVGIVYRAAVEQAQRREEALRHVHESAAREMVQAGLFERRAVRAASRERAVQEARLYEIHGRQDAPAAAGPLDCRVELSGILVSTRGAK